MKKALRNAKKFAGEAQLQQLFDACDKDGVTSALTFERCSTLRARVLCAGRAHGGGVNRRQTQRTVAAKPFCRTAQANHGIF